ncbi:MAG TPA: hypothetical protein VGS07_17270 [Thermoanaerobaculia bacterium]|jgi:hypothetical protein|nr:hypothetical protein [Thermoanaerobaculia bacterium]
MSKRLFLLLVGVTLVSAAVLRPAKVLAMCGCGVAPVHQTATYPGAGASCTAAESVWASAAAGEAEADASCPYGPCNVVTHITVSCYWDPAVGAYRESGYETYHCNLWCP